MLYICIFDENERMCLNLLSTFICPPTLLITLEIWLAVDDTLSGNPNIKLSKDDLKKFFLVATSQALSIPREPLWSDRWRCHGLSIGTCTCWSFHGPPWKNLAPTIRWSCNLFQPHICGWHLLPIQQQKRCFGIFPGHKWWTPKHQIQHGDGGQSQTTVPRCPLGQQRSFLSCRICLSHEHLHSPSRQLS